MKKQQPPQTRKPRMSSAERNRKARSAATGENNVPAIEEPWEQRLRCAAVDAAFSDANDLRVL